MTIQGRMSPDRLAGLGALPGDSLVWDRARFVPGRPLPATVFSYTGTVAVVTGSHRLYNDTGRTLRLATVRASLGTAPTGAAAIVDVNKNGTTIFTTQADRPTIAVSTNTATGTPTVTTWPAGEYLTVDIDQIGSTIAGANLTVTVGAY